MNIINNIFFITMMSEGTIILKIVYPYTVRYDYSVKQLFLQLDKLLSSGTILAAFNSISTSQYQFPLVEYLCL